MLRLLEPLGVLTDGCFALGLGAGEHLNEHIVGAGLGEQHRRSSKAVDIIRGLLR